MNWLTPVRLVGFTVLVLTLASGAMPAAANLRDSKGNLVFRGEHVEDNNSSAKRTLPINVAFRGGSPATSGKVAFHVSHGYPGWGKRSSKNILCGGARYVVYTSPVASSSTDVYAPPIMNGTTNPSCQKQRHARFFTDGLHSDQFQHETDGNFMLAQFHRETVRPNLGFPPVKHKVNESAAHSRYVMMREMSQDGGVDHKVDYRWIVHPGQAGTTGGKPNDGVIGRVSSAHR